MKAVVALVLVCGCGRLEFEYGVLGDGGAGSGDGDGGAACTWSPFAPPVRLPGPVQSGFDEWMGTPFRGDLSLMFHRYATANSDLYLADRPTTAAQFQNVQVVAELSTGSNQWAPALTEDGLVIVYADNAVGGIFDLMTASRASTAMPFGAPSALAALNSPASETNAWISADGLRVVLTSDRSGVRRLYETTRASRAVPFGAPALLDLGAGDASDAGLSADALDLWFSSTRAGGMGGLDLWFARRPAVDQPFGTPVHVPELSSARDELGIRLSSDGATIYLSYDTLVAGGGAADIWTATRTCL